MAGSLTSAVRRYGGAMALRGRDWTIAAGTHRVTVAEVGATLAGYEADGRVVTPGWDPSVLPPKGCGATLVPWPNRIAGARYTFAGETQQLAATEPDTGNAIHGLGRWERWAPARQDEHLLTLGLDIVPQKGYPFEVRAEVTYEVHAERGLTVTLGARNVGDRAAPFGAGSHPYLATGGTRLDDVTLTLPARQILVTDERSVPIGVRTLDHDFRGGRALGADRYDDCFTGLDTIDGRGEVVVDTGEHATRLWFDDAFAFLQVFTVPELVPGCGGIAVEPMTCAPNAFNSGDGIIVVQPGEAWTGSWGIQPLR
ncbi:aldose 1-epimerase family protein [Jatrophihabitans fulvus]